VAHGRNAGVTESRIFKGTELGCPLVAHPEHNHDTHLDEAGCDAGTGGDNCLQAAVMYHEVAHCNTQHTHYRWKATQQLTAWSRVILEKLTVTQLVKKCPACYGT
jgi:hypothetical protein